MATAHQIAANRRNAQRSTGPRSRAGRKRSSRNSFRHGLAAGIIGDAECIKRVDRLAGEIAGGTTDIIIIGCARTMAQAEFDLAQVRRVKLALMSRSVLFGGFETPDASQPPGQPKRVQAERNQTPRLPTDGTADSIGAGLSDLIKLDRYERRAAARRDHALHILLERKK